MEIKDFNKWALNEVLRYFWGGIFFFAAWKIFRVQVPDFLEIQASHFHLEDPYNLTIFFFLSGSLLSALYRAMFVPVVDSIHLRIHEEKDCILRFIERNITPRAFGRLVNVYRTIRDNEDYFDKELKAQVYLQRSEVHLLYLASFILLLVACVKFLNLFPDLTQIMVNIGFLFIMLLLSSLLFLLGMMLDTDICQKEREYIRPKQESLIDFMGLFMEEKKEMHERAKHHKSGVAQ